MLGSCFDDIWGFGKGPTIVVTIKNSLPAMHNLCVMNAYLFSPSHL